MDFLHICDALKQLGRTLENGHSQLAAGARSTEAARTLYEGKALLDGMPPTRVQRQPQRRTDVPRGQRRRGRRSICVASDARGGSGVQRGAVTSSTVLEPNGP